MRLCAGTDFNFGDKIISAFDYRDGVTDIAFETNCLLLIIEMFTIVTAETTRGINMPQVIRVCSPIDLLVVEDCTIVDIF